MRHSPFYRVFFLVLSFNLTSFWFVLVSFISLIFIFAVPGVLPQPLGIHLTWFCFLFTRIWSVPVIPPARSTGPQMHTEQHKHFRGQVLDLKAFSSADHCVSSQHALPGSSKEPLQAPLSSLQLCLFPLQPVCVQGKNVFAHKYLQYGRALHMHWDSVLTWGLCVQFSGVLSCSRSTDLIETCWDQNFSS